LLAELALSGPPGMFGVGLLFLILGLWLRRQYQPYMPELPVAAGTAFACGGAALMVVGVAWASGRRIRRSAAALPATLQTWKFKRRRPVEAQPAPRDGQAFERIVADFFRRQGYEVEETGTHGQVGDRVLITIAGEGRTRRSRLPTGTSDAKVLPSVHPGVHRSARV
jgi:hypothetical protein